MRRCFLMVLLLVGCTRNDLPTAEVLSSLRVLSMKVDVPETTVGTTVNITPLVSDATGGGRALTYHVEGCVDTGTVSCEGAPDKVVIVDSASLSGLISPNYTGNAPSFAVTVPGTLLDGKATYEKQNGVSYLVSYTVTPAGGTPVSSIKRVYASTKTTPNANPSVSSVQSGGSALTTLPTAATDLSVTLGSGSAENYTIYYPDGTNVTQTEAITVSWFTFNGSLNRSTTLSTDTNHFTPPASTGALVVVVRDGRGGEDSKVFSW